MVLLLDQSVQNDEASVHLSDQEATAHDHINKKDPKAPPLLDFVPMTYNSFPRKRVAIFKTKPKNWDNYMTIGTANKTGAAKLYAERLADPNSGTHTWKTGHSDIEVYKHTSDSKGVDSVYTTAAELGLNHDFQRGVNFSQHGGSWTDNAWSYIQIYNSTQDHFNTSTKYAAQPSTLYRDLFGPKGSIKYIKNDAARSAVVKLGNSKRSAQETQHAIQTLNDFGIVTSKVAKDSHAKAMHGHNTTILKDHSRHSIEFVQYKIELGALSEVWSPNPDGWLKDSEKNPKGEQADAVERLCVPVGVAGATNATGCDRLYDAYYDQKKWIQSGSLHDCNASSAAWKNELANSARSSLIDGAEIGKSKNTVFRFLTNLTAPEVGCVYSPTKNDGVKRRYVCTGLQYLPLTIEGLFVDNPENRWLDPTQLKREMFATPGNCMAKVITVDGISASKWKNTNCLRVQPAGVIDCSANKNKNKCISSATHVPPNVAYASKWGTNHHSTPPEYKANYQETKEWFEGIVYPYVKANDTFYRQKYPKIQIDYAAQHGWGNFRRVVLQKKDSSDYCNADSIYKFIQSGSLPRGIPTPPNYPSVDPGITYLENIWKNFNDLGLTEPRVLAILAGAIPVGYFATEYKHVEAVPMYLVGAVVSVVMVYHEPDPNSKKGIGGELTTIYNDYKALIEELDAIARGAKAASKKSQEAARTLLNFLEHLVIYVGVFVTGTLGTLFVTRETAKYSGPGALEIVPEEFLIGMGLTFLVEFIVSVVLGDFQKLIWLMVKGAFNLGIEGVKKVWHGLTQCALLGNC